MPNGNFNELMIEATSPSPQVTAALRYAARETNNSFGALLDAARAESSFNPTAQSRSSSARGLFQFTRATWLSIARRHADDAGINPTISDENLLALRDDPKISAIMAGHLANENRAILERSLGRSVSDREVYVAHFMGASGATRLLRLADTHPLHPAARTFPREAAANRGIFYEGNHMRSVAEVTAVLTGKITQDLAPYDRIDARTIATADVISSSNARVRSPTRLLYVDADVRLDSEQVLLEQLARGTADDARWKADA
jgi:hypothetical protein